MCAETYIKITPMPLIPVRPSHYMGFLLALAHPDVDVPFPCDNPTAQIHFLHQPNATSKIILESPNTSTTR